MDHATPTVRPAIRLLLLGAVASLTALSAMAGPRDRGESDLPSVVRVRRGGPGNTDGGVGVVRSPRAARALLEAAGTVEDAEGGAMSPSGSITPDPGGTTDELVDLDPLKAGLPDAVNGEPDGGGGPGRGEEIEFVDIGVRGKRSGRTIILWGAEFAFVDCEIVVADGLAVGYTGAIGQIGPNPGSASMMKFTLEQGGEITLTVQPAATGSLTTPSRPVRTLTMQVP